MSVGKAVIRLIVTAKGGGDGVATALCTRLTAPSEETFFPCLTTARVISVFGDT